MAFDRGMRDAGCEEYLPKPAPTGGHLLRQLEVNRSQGNRWVAYLLEACCSGDGLSPGTYRVRVECWRQAPMMETDGVSYVAADASLADLEIPVDSSAVDHDIDVPLAQK